MKSRKVIKVSVDMGMMVLLPLLMAYSLIGETAHEWLGIAMLLLFVLHHALNIAWLKSLFRGRYTPLRAYLTAINGMLLLIMVLQPLSGILLSKHIFRLSGLGGMSVARTAHLLLSHWGFVLMSLHIGNHAGAHPAKGKAQTKKGFPIQTILALAVSLYGIYAFVRRGLGSHLFLRSQFVFFDPDASRLHFLTDYAAIMCLFACIGTVFSRGLRTLRMPNQVRHPG